MIDEKKDLSGLARCLELPVRIFPTNATLENYGISNLIKNKFILHFIYNDFYFYSCNCNEMFLSDFHCLVDQLQKEA